MNREKNIFMSSHLTFKQLNSERNATVNASVFTPVYVYMKYMCIYCIVCQRFYRNSHHFRITVLLFRDLCSPN